MFTRSLPHSTNTKSSLRINSNKNSISSPRYSIRSRLVWERENREAIVDGVEEMRTMTMRWTTMRRRKLVSWSLWVSTRLVEVLQPWSHSWHSLPILLTLRQQTQAMINRSKSKKKPGKLKQLSKLRRNRHRSITRSSNSMTMSNSSQTSYRVKCLQTTNLSFLSTLVVGLGPQRTSPLMCREFRFIGTKSS